MITPSLGPGYTLGATGIRLSEVQSKVRDRIQEADNPADYEPSACLCGSTDADILLATMDRHGLACRNVLCPACGLIRITPRWKADRYRRFYEMEYRDLYNRIDLSKEAFAKAAAESDWNKKFTSWIRACVEKYGNGSDPIKVVEIGAGAGWNLHGLPSMWKKMGYDVDREYLRLGETFFGLEMKFGMLDDALGDAQLADVIILSHVVEHLLDPVSALRAVAEKMQPGAMVLIEVPGIFRLHWTARNPMIYLQNAHVYTFCARTLANVCEAAGLSTLTGDEICRTACIKAGSIPRIEIDKRAAFHVLRYLKSSTKGNTIHQKLRSIPWIGRIFSGLWWRLYFPWLKFLVPAQSG